MARQVTAQIRLQVVGGQATPAPPVGPALGQHGVNIGAFVTQFNDRTKEMRGITVPVVITVYSDRSFEFIVKSPPAAVLLKQAAGIALEKKPREPKAAKEPKDGKGPKADKTSPAAPAAEGQAPAAGDGAAAPAGDKAAAPAPGEQQAKKRGKAPGIPPRRGKKLRNQMKAA